MPDDNGCGGCGDKGGRDQPAQDKGGGQARWVSGASLSCTDCSESESALALRKLREDCGGDAGGGCANKLDLLAAAAQQLLQD